MNKTTNKQCPPHMPVGHIVYHESRVARHNVFLFFLVSFKYRYRMYQESKHLQLQLKRSGNCLVFCGWDCSNRGPLQAETESHLTFSCGKMLYYWNSLFLWCFDLLPFPNYLNSDPRGKKMKTKDMVWNFRLEGNWLYFEFRKERVFSHLYELGGSKPNLGQILASLWTWDSALMGFWIWSQADPDSSSHYRPVHTWEHHALSLASSMADVGLVPVFSSRVCVS